MSSPEPFQNGEGLSQNIALKSPLSPLPCYFIFLLKWICAQPGSKTTLKSSCYSNRNHQPPPLSLPPFFPSLYNPTPPNPTPPTHPIEYTLLCRQWHSLLSYPYKIDRLLSFNLDSVTFVFVQGGRVHRLYVWKRIVTLNTPKIIEHEISEQP